MNDTDRWADPKVYGYMSEESFQVKWSIVDHFVQKYSKKPWRILDLGCGKINAIDFLPANEIERYVGLDYTPDVVSWLRENKKGEYELERLEDLAPSKVEGKFNCLIWAGIGLSAAHPSADKPVHFFYSILQKYLSFLEPEGILILDGIIGRKKLFQMLAQGLNLRHLNGCELHLPYVPKESMTYLSVVKLRFLDVYIQA